MEQQQQGGVNQGILDAISDLHRPCLRGERQDHHRLFIQHQQNVNLQSVQFLVDFLRGESHKVTELKLFYSNLLQPSEGSLDVLIDFFANQTTLTKVILGHFNFGSAEEALQLIAAVQSNILITDLTIFGFRNLQGAAFGNCLSGVLRNATHLQRLELGNDLDALRALQPSLRTNRHLKILDLSHSGIRDDGLHLIADALVGNTTIEVLDITANDIGPNGLDDITRLVEFTQLKTIHMERNDDLFADMDATKKFISILHKHTSLEELPGLDLDSYPELDEQVLATIDNILARNRILKRANALFALQPRTGLPIGSKSGIWYMAMSQMARSHQADRDDEGDEDKEDDKRDDDDDDEDDDEAANAVPTYPGVSAIFKIFQARPAILEYQLPRPSAAAASGAIQRRERDSPRVKRRRIL